MKRPINFCWRKLSAIKNRGYETGFLKAKKVSACVVSVGNIAAGGSGKTPFALALARRLCKQVPTALLSRGYLSQFEKRKIPTKALPKHSWREIGDEAALLRARLPQAGLFVGRKRALAAKMAIKEGFRLLILDDGMQHRALSRDIEVIMLHGGDLFGEKSFCREGPAGLKRADYIIISNANILELASQKIEIRKYSVAPIIASRLKLSAVLDLDNQSKILRPGSCCGIFCGLARPQNFERQVESLQVRALSKLFLKDHRIPSMEKLKAFSEMVKKSGGEYLLCSEKDRIKLKELVSLPVYYLKMDWEIVEGFEVFENLIAEIIEKVNNLS